MRIMAAFIAFALFSGAAAAHDYTLGELRIEHPWARATPGRIKTAAVYLELWNDGATPDRLVRIETPVAAGATLHRTETTGGVARMSAVADFAVGPGDAAVLSPQTGHHIMFEGLKQPLKQGERVPMTLTFEKAGAVTIEVAVEAAAARGSGHGHVHH